jgi:hypothetical protein
MSQENMSSTFTKAILVYCRPRLGYGYLLRDYCPLVNGVTSIIDEAEFDAIRWYSFWKNISYNLVYGAYCNKD